MSLRTTTLLFLLCFAASSRAATTFYGPSGYLSSADIPDGFVCDICDDCVHFIEDFEDNSLDDRITITGLEGQIIGPDFATGLDKLTDSVDGDDGSIDGVGNEGYSYFSRGTSLTVTFSTPVKSAGLVWTDGDIGTMTSFEAFDADGASLGVVGPFGLSDDSFQGTTAEDAFFGAMDTDGIGSLTISNAGGTGIEIDHIQFSDCSQCVPEPNGLLLAAFGCLGIAGLRRRR